MEPKIPLCPYIDNEGQENNPLYGIQITYYFEPVETDYGIFVKYTIDLDNETRIVGCARSDNRAKAILFQKLSEHYLERAKNV